MKLNWMQITDQGLRDSLKTWNNNLKNQILTLSKFSKTLHQYQKLLISIQRVGLTKKKNHYLFQVTQTIHKFLKAQICSNKIIQLSTMTQLSKLGLVDMEKYTLYRRKTINHIMHLNSFSKQTKTSSNLTLSRMKLHSCLFVIMKTQSDIMMVTFSSKNSGFSQSTWTQVA